MLVPARFEMNSIFTYIYIYTHYICTDFLKNLTLLDFSRKEVESELLSVMFAEMIDPIAPECFSSAQSVDTQNTLDFTDFMEFKLNRILSFLV